MIKPLAVDRQAFPAQDILGQIEGKPIGIVETKGDLTGQPILTTTFHLATLIGEKTQTLVERLSEAFLFRGHCLANPGPMLDQLRIS